MTGRLQNKVAIITGAASGIGKAAALLFAEQGASVVLADMQAEKLKEVETTICKTGGNAISQTTNISDESEVKALVTLALERFKQIDILCNNAGISGGVSAIDQEDLAEWQKVFAINVFGIMLATKHVAKHMMERKKGSIVNTASVAGIRGGAGGNAYSASKAAVINFTRTAACDFGQYNVRVNAVCPGLIETGMTQAIFDWAREAGKGHKLGSRCEMQRYGNPEEVAHAMLFLASDDASYITGQALPVDGGNTASLNLPGMKV